MAESVCTGKYIHTVLESFNSNYEIIKSSFESAANFSIYLHTQLPKGESPSQSCDLWKQNFGKQTHTNWIVKETFPSAVNYVYRKVYSCQHSKLNKSKCHAKQPNYTKYKDKNCKATIDIKIQKVTKDTKKKHKHIKEGRTATIKIDFHHSHPVNAEALRMPKDTEGMFYFENGMAPAAAKNFHELDLMERNPEIEDMKMLSDAQKNPTSSQIYGLYNKHREQHFGGRTQQAVKVRDKLKLKQEELADKGTEMLINTSQVTRTVEQNEMHVDDEKEKNKVLAELKYQLERLGDLAHGVSTNSIKNLCSEISKIETVSQFNDFCHTKSILGSRNTNISVQPTAISRRKKRPGLSSGSLRMQAGSPELEESRSTIKKCKKNLS